MPKKRITLEGFLVTIQKRGGKLLTTPIGFKPKNQCTIECKEGHVWTAIARNVYYGSWCPHCSRSQSPNKPKSNKGSLVLHCFEGHEWKPTEREILIDAKCPQCEPKTAPPISFLSCLGRITFNSKA